MKKLLLSAVAVCAVVAAGGYFVAVEKFVAEAENFKESLASSEIFSAKSILIEKYKFQVALDGFSIHMPKQAKGGEGDTVPTELLNVQADINTPIKLQYKPFLNKLEVLIPAKEYEVINEVGGKPITLQVSGDAGATVLQLSKIPSFKNQSLPNFLSEYVEKVSKSSAKLALKVKDAQHPFLSFDELHSVGMREKLEVGDRVTFDYDLKGYMYDFSELLKAYVPAGSDEALKGLQDLVKLSMPLAELKDTKRDSAGQVTFAGNLHEIISTLKSTADSAGQPADWLKALLGASFTFVAQDRMLGSKVDADIKVSMPKSEADMNSELGYRISATISPELQKILPKIYFEQIKVVKPELNITQDAVEALLPDLAALGKIVFDLQAKGDIKKKVGQAHLEMSSTEYGIYAKADVTENNMTVKVTVKNYEALLKNLQAYALKIVGHPAMTGQFDPQIKDQILGSIEMAKTTLKSMGKEETVDGKPAIVIEQIIPTALFGLIPAGGVNGANNN